MISPSTAIFVRDPSHVGMVRRAAADLVRNLGFDEPAAGRVAIVATEAANNLLKHARNGRILLRRLSQAEGAGVEILSVDEGPGMHDVARCMADGYSTAGSPGTGLGAISRLASAFDIYSKSGSGTVLVAQLWSQTARRGPLKMGAVCLPMHEGEPCGDAWASQVNSEGIQILVADGLGHGPLAAKAAVEAVRVFHSHPGLAPAALVRALHEPLRHTRGASLAVTELNNTAGVIRHSGLGNISGVSVGPGSVQSMVSHNGIVGHEVHTVAEFTYSWGSERTLILHSDGLLSRWKLDSYPGLIARHPALIAGVLYRDFLRGRDDVTVVVARQRSNSEPEKPGLWSES